MRTPASSPASRIVVEPSASALDQGRAEALDVQGVGEVGVGPVALGSIEQAGWATDPRPALAPVRDDLIECRQVENAGLVVEVLDQSQATRGGIRAQFVGEDDVLGAGRQVHVDDVG